MSARIESAEVRSAGGRAVAAIQKYLRAVCEGFGGRVETVSRPAVGASS